MQAIAARDQALRSMLVALPPTLADVRTTTDTLNTVSRVAAPVVTNLTEAVRALRPAIVLLQPATEIGRLVVSELGAASPGLTTTLNDLTSLSGPAVSAVPRVTKTLCQLNPVIRYAKPYTDDFIQTLIGLGSASNAYDTLGHTIRLAPTINDSSLVGAPPAVNQAAYLLLHTGLLSKAGALTWDPYPPPGQVGKSTAAGKRDIIGPSQVPSTGYRYPHILADC
jgi:hypothetical protein